MVSGHQQRCSSDAGHDEVGGLNESKEKEKGDDAKCNEAKLLGKDAAVGRIEGGGGGTRYQQY